MCAALHVVIVASYRQTSMSASRKVFKIIKRLTRTRLFRCCRQPQLRLACCCASPTCAPCIRLHWTPFTMQ